MKQELFSIFDIKAATFGGPFIAHNAALAMRNVSAAVRDGVSLLSKYPEDFQLFHLGSFDDEAGRFDSLVPPVFVCLLSNLKGVQDG